MHEQHTRCFPNVVANFRRSLWYLECTRQTRLVRYAATFRPSYLPFDKISPRRFPSHRSFVYSFLRSFVSAAKNRDPSPYRTARATPFTRYRFAHGFHPVFSDEITTERKKHAARRALYGDDNVTKRCPDPPPPEQKVTSALTSYLRRESLVTIKPLELQQPPEFLVNAGSLSSGEGDDREGQSMSNASGVGGGKLRGRYELEDEHGKHSKGVVRKVLQRGALQFSDDTSSGSDGDFSLPPPGYNGFILTQLWNEDPVGSTPRKNRDGKGGGAGEPSRASSPMMEAASSVAATFRAEMERKDTVHTNRAQEEARGYDGSHRGLDVPVGRNSPQVCS